MLNGKRALIVEDEVIVAMMIEDMLNDLGCLSIETVSQFDIALDMASSLDLDLAVLDINLDGKFTYPVADALYARKIPFLFATGYGVGGLPEQYKHITTLQKPFEDRAFVHAIVGLMS